MTAPLAFDAPAGLGLALATLLHGAHNLISSDATTFLPGGNATRIREERQAPRLPLSFTTRATLVENFTESFLFGRARPARFAISARVVPTTSVRIGDAIQVGADLAEWSAFLRDLARDEAPTPARRSAQSLIEDAIQILETRPDLRGALIERLFEKAARSRALYGDAPLNFNPVRGAAGTTWASDADFLVSVALAAGIPTTALDALFVRHYDAVHREAGAERVFADLAASAAQSPETQALVFDVSRLLSTDADDASSRSTLDALRGAIPKLAAVEPASRPPLYLLSKTPEVSGAELIAQLTRRYPDMADLRRLTTDVLTTVDRPAIARDGVFLLGHIFELLQASDARINEITVFGARNEDFDVQGLDRVVTLVTLSEVFERFFKEQRLIQIQA
jgi:hypothetical protein